MPASTPISSTALLAGATGLVGTHLLPLLLDRYESVTVLTRRPIENPHPRLVQLITSFDTLPEFDAPKDVYCTLGTTIKKAGSQEAFRKVDHDYVLDIARQAAAAGSRQFLVVSSVGADRRSPNFYLRTKGELEDALSALPFQALHIFHPSLLMGRRAETRVAERMGIAVAKLAAPLLLGSFCKYRPIPASAVARAMASAARQAQAGRHIYSYTEIQALADIR